MKNEYYPFGPKHMEPIMAQFKPFKSVCIRLSPIDGRVIAAESYPNTMYFNLEFANDSKY